MAKFAIRVGQEGDAETIIAFNKAMALETENKMLVDTVIASGVRALINAPQDGFYLVAENGHHIAGSLMVTKEWSDWRNAHFWWIQSVYVEPEFRRQGVLSQLYDTVKSMAISTSGVCGLRLYVEKNNASAQKTYEILGMNETCYKLYEEAL